jgi:hypothetical protein
VQATKVYIVLPLVNGVVTTVNGSTLTLTSLDGTTRTVTVSSATTYDKAGHSATFSDISNGTAVAAQGSIGSDGVLSAVRVEIQTPRVAGQVTSVNGSTITLSNMRGAHGGRGAIGTNETTGVSETVTVVTSGQTTYSVISATAGMTPTATTGTLGDVKTGASIIAQGTLRSDGKTLDALTITVLPASANGGPYQRHGRHGSFGRGFGGFGGFGGPGGPNGPRGGFSGGFGSGGNSAGSPNSGFGGNSAGSPNSGFGDRSPAGGWNGGAPNSGATVGTANA